MKKNIIGTAFIAIALLTTACSQEHELVESNAIAFDVSTSWHNTRALSYGDITDLQASTIFVTAKYTSDNTHVHFQDEPLSYVSSAWSINKYYWVPETPMDFFARAPHDDANFKGDIVNTNTFRYQVPAVLTNQKDLLCAVSTNKYKEVVPLVFNHTLSQICFTATVVENWVITINSITINNIYDTGIYNYNTNTWTVPSATSDKQDKDYLFTLASPVSITGPEATTTALTAADSHVLILLPQTLVPWTLDGTTITQANTEDNYKCYLDIECRIWDNSIGNYLVGASDFGHIYVPFSDTWLVGKKYTYNLAFGDGYKPNGDPTTQLVIIKSTITDWAENAQKSGWAVFD